MNNQVIQTNFDVLKSYGSKSAISKVEDLKNTYLDTSQLRITNNVRQAVYLMAHALIVRHTAVGPGTVKSSLPEFNGQDIIWILARVYIIKKFF